MTTLFTLNLLRVLFVIFAGTIGSLIGEELEQAPWVGAMVGTVIGLLVVLTDRLLNGFSLRTFSSATLGLLMGLLFSRLLLASDVLKYQPENLQWMAGLIVYCVFGYLGMMLAVRSNRDEFSLIIPYVRFRQAAVQDAPLLVDTNIIIDGRISALYAAGFLNGSLVVPRFVLDELQRLADSSDPLKRRKGRRGLDSLNEMRESEPLSVSIHETTGDKDVPVDTRLVQTAKMLQARLLTNDSNLCRIAQLQNVPVLNLNELAAAMRPALKPGDELELELTKEGRDAHQALGYLPDGTMIVVNHARQQIGQTVLVTVGSALQTSAGRLYFGELVKSS